MTDESTTDENATAPASAAFSDLLAADRTFAETLHEPNFTGLLETIC